jgi:hypothetical protein
MNSNSPLCVGVGWQGALTSALLPALSVVFMWLGRDSPPEYRHNISHNALYAMSKTIQISSPAQFAGLLKSSAVVVADCKFPFLGFRTPWRGNF